MVALRHAVGLLGLLAIVAGVWGRFGWEWAAIVAGLPIAAFYMYGEFREARNQGMI